MQIEHLKPQVIKLHEKYGDQNLDPVFGAGRIENPEICFVFMNPTARNISASKDWKGLKAQWLGTKTVWKLFVETGYFDRKLFERIRNMKPGDWTEDFASEIYSHINEQNIYITNLAKCTQSDAKPLPNSVFREFRDNTLEEIGTINPKAIVTFGNQVSSILIEKPISVSQTRKQAFHVNIGERNYPVFPLYYPVGQGMRNIDKAIEDIIWIKENVL